MLMSRLGVAAGEQGETDTIIKDLNSLLPTVALYPSLESCLEQRIKSPLR
jgi:hypothetical protein